jgi:hypothetical protein
VSQHCVINGKALGQVSIFDKRKHAARMLDELFNAGLVAQTAVRSMRDGQHADD